MEDISVKIEPPDFDWDTSDASSSAFQPCTSSASTFDEESELSSKIKEEPQEEFSEEVENDPLQEYSFETDHPALKNNSDYHALLKAVVVLEAQRAKAVQDLDRLYELQEEALADPIAFVARLQKGEKIDVPGPQKICPIPDIDWNKYTLNNISALGRRQLTRLSTKTTQDLLKGSKGKSKFTDQKSSKVNQYWSAEEQKRLEELLVQFPPEEVESRRWEKIANCLENRTPIQVASRVQKYFIKLMKAGIPIPGRMPSMAYLKKPKRNVIRSNPSTFLVSHTLPVYMPEVDYELNYNHYQPQTSEENSMDSRADMSDDEEISAEFKDTPEFKELMLLKKVQREKLQTCGLTEHHGFKCCSCKVEPIVGVRWHCIDCKPPMSIDFCSNCAESLYEFGQHTSDHKLEDIHDNNPDTGQTDCDYTQFLGSDYNYLNPNFMAAA